MARSRALPVALATVALALAGCLSESPKSGPDGGSTPGPGALPASITPAQAFETYSRAFDNLDGPSSPARALVTVHVEARNATEPQSMDARIFFDRAAKTVAFAFKGDFPSDESGMSAFLSGRDILFARVDRTELCGFKEAIGAFYNASAAPPASISDAGGCGSTPSGSRDFFDEARNVTLDAVRTAKPVMYKGKPAVEISVSSTADEQTIAGTFVMYLDPALPAHAEFSSKEADGEEPMDKDGFVTLDAAYDAAATFPEEAALARLATLSFRTIEEMKPVGSPSGEPGPQTVTIQPSGDAAKRLTLAEAQAQLVQPSPGGGPPTPKLTLDLDQGTAENDHAKLTFVDADADGKVSPGDSITFEPKSDDAKSLILGILDETTGYRAVPGAGVAAVLAGLAAAVGLAGRRRA